MISKEIQYQIEGLFKREAGARMSMMTHTVRRLSQHRTVHEQLIVLDNQHTFSLFVIMALS